MAKAPTASAAPVTPTPSAPSVPITPTPSWWEAYLSIKGVFVLTILLAIVMVAGSNIPGGLSAKIGDFLWDNLLIIAALVAAATTLIALTAGTKAVLKKPAFVTEWMVYSIAGICVAAIFAIIAVKLLFPGEETEVFKAWRSDIAAVIDPRPEKSALPEWWSWWYVIGGIGLALALYAMGKDAAKNVGAGLGKLFWPVTILTLVGLLVWAVGTGQIKLPTQAGIKAQAMTPSLQPSVLIKPTWSNWLPIPCGKTVSWGQSVDVDEMPSKDGKWTEAVRFKSDRFAGITMPLAWTDAPCYK